MANYTHSRLIVKIKPGVEELWLAAIENHTWINNSVFEPPCYWDVDHYPTKPQSGNNCFEYRAVNKRVSPLELLSYIHLFEDFILFKTDFESVDYFTMGTNIIKLGECPYFEIKDDCLTLKNGRAVHPSAILSLSEDVLNEGAPSIPFMGTKPYKSEIKLFHYQSTGLEILGTSKPQ